MDSFNEAWDIICSYCKTKITEVAYKTWISRIKPIEIDFDSGNAILMVPNTFHKNTIIKCYSNLLNEAFEQVFGSEIKVVITTENEQNNSSGYISNPEKQIKNKNISENFISDINSEYEFTFSTFIVGSSNKFAHAACIAVSANPAGSYNPLFIYGNSGLGKTHLLYAICNEVKRNSKDTNIVYIKGDDFTNELISAIRSGNTTDFHNKYRNADILLVDDIQFIAGKDSTQEEFFHTFNTLYESKKQIVLTSDRPPKEIKTLEDRLRTRFEWGLIADVQPPDYETRIAIIKRKAEVLNFEISDNICKIIANKLKTNIRQLEGLVKKLNAHYMLTNEKLTMNDVESAIEEILSDDKPAYVTVEKIIEEVARTYNVNPQDVKSAKRASAISKARKISMYLAREMTNLSLNSIGDEFGGRDHSTVVYSIQQIEKELKKDLRLKETVDDIFKNIKNI
ncbi:MAG: chromosomal replication initiator protein DnaA [Clostridia bacterium]|nr:chromosomal replication initiator protein DnaA [Clostridia bacterium]